MNLTIDPTSFIRPAAQIAKQAHTGQFRRDGITPYFTHCNDVARRVQVLCPTTDEAERETLIDVSFLHDVLEDTDVTIEDLREAGIRPAVIEAVQLLTKPADHSYADYIAAIKSNPIAKRVKIADMLSNLADTPTEKQILKYAQALQFLLS